MAFEKLRIIVMTAIPKPRSREGSARLPKPPQPKTRLEDAMLIPSAVCADRKIPKVLRLLMGVRF